MHEARPLLHRHHVCHQPAATALLIKSKSPRTPLLPLLIATQLMEIGWVAFNYAGIEHIVLDHGVVQLGFLPYSHSVIGAIALSLLVWAVVAWVFRLPAVGLALGIAVISHLVLDLIMHESDIALAPVVGSMRVGLGLYRYPFIAFALELAYGIGCWWAFRGRAGLLVAIVLLNFLDLPLMLHPMMPAGLSLRAMDVLITTVIAIQIVVSWTLVWFLARTPREKASAAKPSPADKRSVLA